MSNVGREGRSFQRISPDDLRRLASIAAADRAEFFAKHQAWAKLYESRLVAAAFCNKHCDFGLPKLGRSPDRADMVGRRVDLLARGIAYRPGEDPAEAIRRWLQEARTKSAVLRAQKAVILLDPPK